MSFPYERRRHRPIPRARFVRRFLAHVAVAGILIAPVAHRILHRFHWDEQER